MPQRLSLSVDREVCIGSRMCLLEAPDVFDFDEDGGFSQVRTTPVERTEETWAAVEFCPREAITARDADTGDQLFP